MAENKRATGVITPISGLITLGAHFVEAQRCLSFTSFSLASRLKQKVPGFAPSGQLDVGQLVSRGRHHSRVAKHYVYLSQPVVGPLGVHSGLVVICISEECNPITKSTSLGQHEA